MQKMTMEHIAAKAGVSKVTVSRYFHSPHLLKPATRAIIGAVIEESGYIYNAQAAEFSKTKSTLVGLIIPTVESSIYARFIDGIQRGLQSSPYTMFIGYTNYSVQEELKLLDMFLQRRVAGIILPGIKPDTRATIRRAVQRGVAVVTTWECRMEEGISCVGFENDRAAFTMTDYLLGIGHCRIGLIMGPFSSEDRVRERRKGYERALRLRGVEPTEEYIIEAHPTLVEGREAMRRLLDLPDPPTAVFAASDALAVGALKAAHDRGLRVPEDISIAGFDNLDSSSFCIPPLTTIEVPAFEMGERAGRIVVEQAVEGKTGSFRYCLETELIIRASTGRPSTGNIVLQPLNS